MKRVSPAVVQIASSKTVKVSRHGGGQGMPDLPPEFRDFFGGGGNFFGMEPRQQRPHREQGLGSGVIIDPQGYVITNNHVVEGANDVRVTLSDHREFKAKVVGTDPKTDVAVLKIDGRNLPTMVIGDSTKLQVGDLALAVGNPFGIGQTVTMGIVSATGRSGLGIEDYEDFIQTDAAINPGNSGGALVNTRGELIGINTAILAGNNGGNQGIGFAIPINMADGVMKQLVAHGKVTRGYVGVGIQALTPAMARAFNLPDSSVGAVVTSVEPNSPGARGGLKEGDVITQVNNTPVLDNNQFRLTVSGMTPGTVVNLKVLRNGQTIPVAVKLGTFPDKIGEGEEDNGQAVPGDDDNGGKSSALQGVTVRPLSPALARQLNIKGENKGLVVTDLDETSAAAQAGLQQGDVIQQVNRKLVTSVSDFRSALRGSENRTVLLLVKRGGGTIFIPVEPNK